MVRYPVRGTVKGSRIFEYLDMRICMCSIKNYCHAERTVTGAENLVFTESWLQRDDQRLDERLSKQCTGGSEVHWEALDENVAD